MDILRDAVQLPERPPRHDVDEALRTGVVWVSWTFRSSQLDAHSGAAHEALELLALEDHDEFLGTLHYLWPRAAAVWCQAFGRRHFRLGVTIKTPDVSLISAWAERAFFPDVALLNLSAEYRRLRNARDDELNGRGQVVEQPVIPMMISIVENPTHEFDLTRQLFGALRLASLHATRKASHSYECKWKSMFQLVEIDATNTFGELSLRDLVYILEIASCGARVRTLRLFLLELSEQNALPFSTALQRLLAAPVEASCVPCETVGLDILATRQTLDGIFSAVLSSQVLLELVACPYDMEVGQRGDRVRVWQWIAIAVFSRLACVTLDKFTLSALGLQAGDIATLVQTLQHHNPLSLLFSAHQVENENMRVSAAKFLLGHPERQPDSRTVEMKTPLSNLRVLELGDKWLSVLLPGWGEAWVRRDEAGVETHPVAPVNRLTRPRGVRHLVFDYPGDEDKPAMLSLLRAVGTKLESLTISWQDTEDVLSNGWVREVLHTCPGLVDVHIENVVVESLNVFSRCYEDGVFRASRLSLDVMHVADSQNAFKLFECLGDMSHTMATHLQEFSLTISASAHRHRWPNIVASALQMLRTNTKLCRFEMQLQLTNDSGEFAWQSEIEAEEKQFASFDGKPVAVQSAPLAPRSKLAILSVTRTQPVLQKFDTAVIRHVFEFAAECRERIVIVSLGNQFS